MGNLPPPARANMMGLTWGVLGARLGAMLGGMEACKASVVQWGVSGHTRGHSEGPRFKFRSACHQPVGTSDFVRPIFVPIGRPRTSHQLNRVRGRSQRI